MTLQVAVKVTADSSGVPAGLVPAETAFGSLNARANVSAAAMGAAMRAAGLLGAALTADKLLGYAEGWTQIGNRLKLANQDSAQLVQTQERLFQAAQKAGVGMASVVDVYSRASQAARELGASQDQLTRFSGGVAQAVALSGSNAEVAAGAIQQLGQALGAGTVHAEEFNSVLAGAPRIAQAVAAGLTAAGGSVSRLKELINDGKVSSKEFFDAFLDQIPRIESEFGTAVPTVARALATLENATMKLVGGANDAVGATKALAQGIEALGNNLDTVASGTLGLAAAIGSVYAARALVPAVTATAQFVQGQVAMRTELLANTGHLLAKEAAMRASAAATVEATAADLAAAVAAQQRAREEVRVMAAAAGHARDVDGAIGRTERIIRTEQAYAAALTARGAADARASEAAAASTAALLAQQEAMARTTVSATLLSRSKDALTGVLGLVGGWWGVAFLAAAGAVYYLATRTTEADRAQEVYNRTLATGRQRAQEMTTATREQAAALVAKQRDDLDAAQADLKKAQAAVAAAQALERQPSARGLGGAAAGAAMLNTAGTVTTLTKNVQAAAAALDALNSVGQKTGDAVGLELASKLARGTGAFASLDKSTSDVMKSLGLTVQSGRLVTAEQADTEKATLALNRAIAAGPGFLRSWGTSMSQVTLILETMKLKVDPVAAAIADMNREIAQMRVPEGAARTALTILQEINKKRAEEGKAPLSTVSPEYLAQLSKAQELETARVKAATDARAAVLDLEKKIAAAQAAGKDAEVARLTRDKAVEQMVARGVDRKIAEANAEQDFAVAVAAAGAAAGEAGQGFLRAADAQTRLAQAAGLGEAAARQAAYANKLAEEAAKGNGNAAAQAAANRREEAAAILTIRNETVRGLELETANTNRLTAAMAVGGEAVRVAQEEEYKLALIRKLGTDATVTGTKAQQALNDAMDAYRKNRAANDNNRLQQERQTANDNLALAQRELDLMGETETARDRALTTLRNQQEAARKVAELGEEGAQQWLAWQEQIADKRAMIDYLKSVQATAKEISGSISEALYDRLMNSTAHTSIVDVFKATFKRIAVAALEAKIVLPIVTQVVGAMPSLFGIQAPASASASASGAGSVAGTVQNWGLGKALNWGADKLGLSNITGNIMNTPVWGSAVSMSSVGGGATVIGTANPIIGSATGVVQAGSLNAANGVVNAGNTAALNASYSGTASGAAGTAGASLGSVLGTAGIGFGVGNLATSLFGIQSKGAGALVGGASGAAAGALAGTFLFPGVGTLVGALLGGGSGVLGGLLGAQKPSVGPTVSSGLNRSADGKSVSSGGYLTDNGGDPAEAQRLGDTIAVAINAALLGGGTLTRDLGIGRTKEKGLFISGSLPYEDFGDNVAEMFRRALLDSGTLQGAGPNTTKAIRNSQARDFEQAALDYRLGAALDAGATAMLEMDKSLAGLERAAKKAAAASYQAAIEEKKRADALQLGDEYARQAAASIRSSFDPVTLTDMQAAIAATNGRFAALSDAVRAMGLAISDAEIAAWKAAETEKILQAHRDEYDAAERAAKGLEAVDAARAVRKRWEASAADDMLAGRNPNQLYADQLRSIFAGITDLGVMARVADGLRDLDKVAAAFADARVAELRASMSQDLELRQAQARAAIAAAGTDAAAAAAAQNYAEMRSLQIAQFRELASVTDEAYRADIMRTQELERQAVVARQSAAATAAQTQAQAQALSAAGDVMADLDRRRAAGATGMTAAERVAAVDSMLRRDLALSRSTDATVAADALQRLTTTRQTAEETYGAVYGAGSAETTAMLKAYEAQVRDLPAVKTWQQQLLEQLAALPAGISAKLDIRGRILELYEPAVLQRIDPAVRPIIEKLHTLAEQGFDFTALPANAQRTIDEVLTRVQGDQPVVALDFTALPAAARRDLTEALGRFANDNRVDEFEWSLLPDDARRLVAEVLGTYRNGVQVDQLTFAEVPVDTQRDVAELLQRSLNGEAVSDWTPITLPGNQTRTVTETVKRDVSETVTSAAMRDLTTGFAATQLQAASIIINKLDAVGRLVWGSGINTVRAITGNWGWGADVAQSAAPTVLTTAAAQYLARYADIADWWAADPSRDPAQHYAQAGMREGRTFAVGGPVVGPGTETSDDIPAWLSHGEFVVRAAAAKAAGYDVMSALNDGNVAGAARMLAGRANDNGPRFSRGGRVGDVVTASGAATVFTSAGAATPWVADGSGAAIAHLTDEVRRLTAEVVTFRRERREDAARSRRLAQDIGADQVDVAERQAADLRIIRRKRPVL